jgi:hypothetical protein
MYAKKRPLLGYVAVKNDATMEHELKCQRSNSYSHNNRRTVGSGVFCTDRVLSNTQYAVKGEQALSFSWNVLFYYRNLSYDSGFGEFQ